MKPMMSNQLIALSGTACIALATLAGAAAEGPTPIGIYRQTTYGRAFIVETPRSVSATAMRGQSQAFHGTAFSELRVRATLRPPSPSTARPELSRVILHFKTSRNGPSVRTVELMAGTQPVFRVENLGLVGDYTVVNRQTNSWTMAPPETMRGPLVLRVKAQFPGGFDSQIDPGELVIAGVVLEFPRVLDSIMRQRPDGRIHP